MSEISRLRAEAKRVRSRVTAKAARIRRNTGAKIAGSEFDPRPELKSINTMNSRQLRASIKRMSGFLDRDVQFVGLHNGVPAPREVWQAYDARQHARRDRAEAHERDIGRYPAMGSDETVGQARARLHGSTTGKTRGPYADVINRPQDITSLSALNKLDKNLKKVLGKNYTRKMLKQGRINAMEALKQMGELELMEMLASLSDYQFDVLWHGTRFAEVTFARYSSEKERLQGNQKERAQERAANEQFEIARDWLDWAATEIPKTRPAGQPEASERIRGFKR